MSGVNFSRAFRGLIVAAALAAPVAVQAQFNVATIDGGIAPAEYGTHANGFNQFVTAGGQNWYCSWDNTNLYIGLNNADVNEGMVIYIDVDSLTPINGGLPAEGALVGFNYDGTSFDALPFRAEFVAYIKNGYREYRNDDGVGGWGSQTAGFGSFGVGASNTREVAIPWTAINGASGRPSQFNWFGYVTSGTGFVYAQTPGENAGGFIGTTARYERYFTVDATGNGTSTKPFANNSFVFNRTTDLVGAGAFDVYDFTMNTAGRSITRAAGPGGSWTIRSRFLVNNGTVSFGASTDTAEVFGNATVNPNGSLTLSSAGLGGANAPAGDLQCYSQFLNTGNLNTNNSELIFTGTSNSTIGTDDPVDFVRTAKLGAATLTALTDVQITDALIMVSGNILPNGNNVQVTFAGPDGVDQGVNRTDGIVLGRLNRSIASASTGSRLFPVGTVTNEYSPVTANFTTGASTAGTLAVTPTDAVHPNLGGSFGISRWWQLAPVTLGTYVTNLSFTYVDEDVTTGTLPNGAADEPQLIAARYTGVGANWDSGNGTSLVTNTATNTADVLGVTNMSPWTLLLNNGLSVDLINFNASTSGPGAPINLSWSTAAEIDSAGFRIHVGSPDGPSIGGLIPAEGSAASGASYSLVDNDGLAAGESRDYYLVEVELDGSTNTYGPATASAGNGPASSVDNWSMY